MLIMLFILKGISIGFSIAAPIGPVGVLCIRRTLQKGKTSGFVSGLGSSSASFLYGVTLIFGFSFFSNFLLEEQFWLRLIGGIFLILMGLKILRSQFELTEKKSSSQTLLQDYISTFFLNITNPITLVSYFAIFSSYGFAEGQAITSSTPFLLIGIFIGSALWWAILSNGISFFRNRLNQRVLLYINRIAGLIVVSFGFCSLPFTVEELLENVMIQQRSPGDEAKRYDDNSSNAVHPNHYPFCNFTTKAADSFDEYKPPDN